MRRKPSGGVLDVTRSVSGDTMNSKLLIFLASAALTACTVEGPIDHYDDRSSGTGGDDGGVTVGAGSGGDPTGGVGAGGPGATTSGGSESGATTGSSSSGGGGTGGQGPAPCPQGMECVDSFPYVHNGNTQGAGSDQFDSYNCGNQNESGPEVVYRVELSSEGFIWLDLGNMPSGVDIDVHILGSLDPNDCLARGHWDAGKLLPAGTYYVTADTWVDGNGHPQAGAYTLGIGALTKQDLTAWGMSSAVASDALRVFDTAWGYDDVDSTAYAVVDFSLHASEQRMWVFDVFQASLRHRTFTTVGEASDSGLDGWADAFSNLSGSHMSSIGLMKAAELYTGSFGPSVRLDGLEYGYNNKVRSRAIVMHPWNGSAPAYVNANPSTGAAATWGCLGVDPNISNDVRQFLANGGLVLSHFDDGNWSVNSNYL